MHYTKSMPYPVFDPSRDNYSKEEYNKRLEELATNEQPKIPVNESKVSLLQRQIKTLELNIRDTIMTIAM